MARTGKALGTYLKQEKLPVAFDMQLSTNEVLLFDLERTEFVQKSKMRDLLQMNQPLTGRGEDAGSALRSRITKRLGELPG
jgi:hypothetical protein